MENIIVHQHLGLKRSALEMQELHLLKHEFGISMMGTLMRTAQCMVINNYQQKQYFMQFSKSGWRTLEPGTPYPSEETVLYKQLVYRALSEEYMGESKASELLGISLSLFHKERKLEALSAVIN